MPTTALRVLLAVSLLLASSPALAAASGVVVIVGGDADANTRKQLSAAVERELRDRREESRRLELAARDVDALVGCVAREMSKECASAFMRGAGASRAIVMRVGRNTRNRAAATTVTGWVVATDGTILVILQGECDACTGAKLEQASTALLDSLLREVEARTTETVLEVRTSPPGAQVEIDGRLVGISNLKHGVYAGPHRVVVQLRGYATENRAITVTAGETKTVDVTLTPTAKAKKPRTPRTGASPSSTSPPRANSLRWVPWTTLGAGVLVGAAGVVLLVRDQHDPSKGPFPYERRETTAVGATTTALGIAIAGASTWWLLRGNDDKPAPPATPAVGFAPGAVTFSVSGRF